MQDWLIEKILNVHSEILENKLVTDNRNIGGPVSILKKSTENLRIEE